MSDLFMNKSSDDWNKLKHLVDLSAENARLKAEVERLHKYVETMERESMSDEYDINHQTRIINGLLTDKERLQAEVERLRKAGDAMVKHIRHGEEVCYEIIDGDEVIKAWNAAKEGKQP